MAWTSIPPSISSAAISCAREPVFSYMKRPVSVTTPTYSASAIGCVTSTPRPFARSQTISAVHDACGSTWLSVPKRVLSWWWSTLRMQRPSRSSADAGVRSMFPQSRNTSTRSARSSGGSVTSPSRWMKRYSYGSGNSSAVRKATASLPSAVRTCCIAASEPTASPSGRSCVVSRNLSLLRSVAIACSRVGREPLSDTSVPGLALEQLLDPLRAVEGVVVDEVERRRVLEVQLLRHAPLEEAVGRAQPVKRAPADAAVAQDGHVHPRLAQVWTGID